MPEDISIDEIAWLRANSPAWRLLRAENARSCSASCTVFVQAAPCAIAVE